MRIIYDYWHSSVYRTTCQSPRRVSILGIVTDSYGCSPQIIPPLKHLPGYILRASVTNTLPRPTPPPKEVILLPMFNDIRDSLRLNDFADRNLMFVSWYLYICVASSSSISCN